MEPSKFDDFQNNSSEMEISGQSREETSASQVELEEAYPMDLVIIKFGKFVNRLARITSVGASNRYNLQILEDNGQISRRDDCAIMNTALLRAKFDILGTDLAKVLIELPKIRAELQIPPYDGSAGPIKNYSGPAAALRDLMPKMGTFMTLPPMYTMSAMPMMTPYGTMNVFPNTGRVPSMALPTPAPPRPTTTTTSTSTVLTGKATTAAAAVTTTTTVGSPLNRHKLKSKNSLEESGAKEDDDDEGESRNNLYWVETAVRSRTMSAQSRRAISTGFFCLWYGGENVQRTQVISVLPLSPSIHVKPAVPPLSVNNLVCELSGSRGSSAYPIPSEAPIASSSAALAATSVTSTATSGVSSSSVTGNQADNSSSSDSKTVISGEGEDMLTEFSGEEELAKELGVPVTSMRHVKRSSLRPLDVDLVKEVFQHRDYGQDVMNGDDDGMKHFIIALVQFAEWDYFQRESYVWPDFILELMKNNNSREEFMRFAKNHLLAQEGVRPLCEVVLFLLCAQHIGVSEEWDEDEWKNNMQCTDNIANLLDNLTEFRVTEEEICRPYCRVGEEFQTCLDDFQFICDPEDISSESSSGDSAVFTIADEQDDENIESFLGSVQLLRQKHLTENQVIEAPLNLSSFKTALNAFLIATKRTLPDETPLQRYRACRVLEEFMATSRRQNKRLFSLCAIKSIVSSSAMTNTVAPVPATDTPMGSHVVAPTSGTTDLPAALQTPSESKSPPLVSAVVSGIASVTETLIDTISVATAHSSQPTQASIKVEGSVTPSLPNHASGVTAADAAPPATCLAGISAVAKTGAGAGAGTGAGTSSGTGISTGASAAVVSSGGEASMSEVGQSVSTVLVDCGGRELEIPIKYCRISTIPDDCALEILFACSGDAALALEKIEAILSPVKAEQEGVDDRFIPSTSSSLWNTSNKQFGIGEELKNGIFSRMCDLDVIVNRIVNTSTELNAFHTLVTRATNDVQKIYRRFNRFIIKQKVRTQSSAVSSSFSSAASASTTKVGTSASTVDSTARLQPSSATKPLTSSVADLESPAGKTPEVSGSSETCRSAEDVFNTFSMKYVLRMYFLMYPAHDEDDNFPVMTAFNSPLFVEYSTQQSSIAAAAAARSLERQAISAARRAANKSNNNNNGGGSEQQDKTASKGRGRPTKEEQARKYAPKINRPNRWPRRLSLTQHNLYWLIPSKMPCLCTGLTFKGKSGGEAQINVINIHPESRRMLVNANHLQPFTEALARQASDERSGAFAAALIEFCNWELLNHVPNTSLLRKWYEFPKFIVDMLVLTSRFMGWRKTVERNPRASAMSRRDNYLFALMEEYEGLSEEDRNARFNAGGYPWDDTPLSGDEEEEDEDDDEEEEGEDEEESGDDDEDNDEEKDNEDDKRRGGGRAQVRGKAARVKNAQPVEELDGSTSDIECYADHKECKSENAKFNRVSNNPVQIIPSRRNHSSGAAGKLDSNKKRGRPHSDGGAAGAQKFPRTKAGGSSSSSNGVDNNNSMNGHESSTASTSATGAAKSKPPPHYVPSLFNLFWIARSQLPCMYYDEPENRFKDRFRVIPICCVTYHYPFLTASNSSGIEPLKLEHLKLITDERTNEFTHALLEFAQQESRKRFQAKISNTGNALLSGVHYPVTGTEDERDSDDGDNNSLVDSSLVGPNELFDWPDFILAMVNQHSKWQSWRKAAERAGAGLKRHQYLRALQAEYDEIKAKEVIAQKKKIEREEKKKNNKKKKPTLQIHSYYNLFWLLRSNLPAIYYDTPENRYDDKFTILPINCCQYQYPTKITNSAVTIEPLTMTNLAHCAEDRTHDFTLALLDFAKWEQKQRRHGGTDLYFSEASINQKKASQRSQEGEEDDDEDDADDDDDDDDDEDEEKMEDSEELYDWPGFILKMLNTPDVWSTWRKRAERGGGRDSKRVVYFRALVEDYRSNQAGKSDEEEEEEEVGVRGGEGGAEIVSGSGGGGGDGGRSNDMEISG